MTYLNVGPGSGTLTASGGIAPTVAPTEPLDAKLQVIFNRLDNLDAKHERLVVLIAERYGIYTD